MTISRRWARPIVTSPTVNGATCVPSPSSGTSRSTGCAAWRRATAGTKHPRTPDMYEKTLYAGWRDMDYNSHMANTAYLDRAADVRMMYFSENGFSADEMLRLKIGPVVMKDEIEYFREVRLLQELRAGLSLAGLAPDGSRFMLRNEFAH